MEKLNELNMRTAIIIIKTKVLIPQTQVNLADFGYPVKTIWVYCFQNFKLFDFPIFRF